MIAYISIAVLVITVIIGYIRNINTGLIGILMAFIVGQYVLGLSAKEIVAGFPTSLIFTLIGMTFLFSTAKVNGTLDKLAMCIAQLAKGNTKLIPVLLFFFCVVLSAMGTGPVIGCAIVVPVAMAIGKSENIPDILIAGSVITGCIAGGLSGITPSGIIAKNLGVEQGIVNYLPIFVSCLLIGTVLFMISYIVLKGWKVEKNTSHGTVDKPKFDRNQIVTTVILAVTLLSILLFKLDTGLAAFCGGVILLLLNVSDQKKAIEGIAWSTILLVGGMSILINIVSVAGGIDVMTEVLSRIMSGKTAAPIMCITAGLMSSVSSASGVVMPSLIPTINGLIGELGGTVSASAILSAIVVGAHVVVASPLSTLGALSLAAANDNTNKQKLFAQLLLMGFGFLVIAGVLGGIGLFYLG